MRPSFEEEIGSPAPLEEPPREKPPKKPAENGAGDTKKRGQAGYTGPEERCFNCRHFDGDARCNLHGWSADGDARCNSFDATEAPAEADSAEEEDEG